MLRASLASFLLIALGSGLGAGRASADDCSESDLRAAVEARAGGTRSLARTPRGRGGSGYGRAGFHSTAAPLYGPFLRNGCAAVVITSQWLSVHPNRQQEDVHFGPVMVIQNDVWELRRGRLRRVAGGEQALLEGEAQLGGPISTQGRDANGDGRLDVCLGARCFSVQGSRVIPAAAQAQPSTLPAQLLPGEVRHAGRITNIAVGRHGAHTLTLAGGATVELRLTTPLPFVVGDTVAIRFQSRSIGIHRVINATVTRPDGTLLVAIAGDGDNQWAPGFQVTPGPIVERSRHSPRHGERQEHGLLVRHLRGRVTVRPNTPGTLRASDGTFTIVGHSISYGPGLRVPDSSEYTMFSIQRVP